MNSDFECFVILWNLSYISWTAFMICHPKFEFILVNSKVRKNFKSAGKTWSVRMTFLFQLLRVFYTESIFPYHYVVDLKPKLCDFHLLYALSSTYLIFLLLDLSRRHIFRLVENMKKIEQSNNQICYNLFNVYVRNFHHSQRAITFIQFICEKSTLFSTSECAPEFCKSSNEVFRLSFLLAFEFLFDCDKKTNPN